MKTRPIVPIGAHSTAALAVSRSAKKHAAQGRNGPRRSAAAHRARRGAEAALDQAGHHFTERRDVIVRLLGAGGPGDPEVSHLAAQPGERPLVHEPGQTVGGVGHQLAPADADEELERLLPRLSGRPLPRARAPGDPGRAPSDRHPGRSHDRAASDQTDPRATGRPASATHPRDRSPPPSLPGRTPMLESSCTLPTTSWPVI
jgi:hypothetical protein